MNVNLLAEMVAGALPDRILVGTRQDGLTAAALMDKAQRAGAWIKSQDVGQVVLCDVNTPAAPVLLVGGSLAETPYVPVNYRLTDEQLQRIVTRTAPSVAVVDEPIVARLGDIDGVKVVTRDQFWKEVEATEPDPTLMGPTDPEAIAVLLFTSGTTGEPKAAVLRHKHLTSYIISSVEFMGSPEEDAALVSVPPYHIAGISAILSQLYNGRRLVYLPAFEESEWVRLARDEGISHAMVVPTMLGRILKVVRDDGQPIPSLRHLSYGGGRMPVQVIEEAMDTLGEVDFVNAYGLTETSSTISVLTPEDHREAMASSDPNVRARLASVGKPFPTLEIEIRDEDGKPLPVGERGEIYVRGEQVSGEYLGRDSTLRDGWFPTNDAGRVDEAGFLYLEGRLDDVIVRGGENMSPGEIEDVLLSHPAVADAAVVGIPDKEWGESVAAAIVLEEGQSVEVGDLQKLVRDNLRSTRVPTVVRFVDELPYNDTGKLLRRVLKVDLAS